MLSYPTIMHPIRQTCLGKPCCRSPLDIDPTFAHAPPHPPSEDDAKDRRQEVIVQHLQPEKGGMVKVAVALQPAVLDLAEALGVVRDDGVDALVDTPPHHRLFVDRPDVQRSIVRLDIANEAGSQRPQQQRHLQQVEGKAGDGEELAGISGREADVADGKAGEVVCAQRKILDLNSRISGVGEITPSKGGGEGATDRPAT